MIGYQTRRGCAAALIIGLMCLGFASPAAAQDIPGLLQNVVDMLSGQTARLLATLAVIIVGILWMFGLFDLRRAGVVVLGIIVVFGAAQIVTMLTGGGA